MRRVLITGTAGFIGFHLAKLLLAEGFRVQGHDGMADYYDVALKQRRYGRGATVFCDLKRVFAPQDSDLRV